MVRVLAVLAFISAVKAALAVERKPDVDDFARGHLVQVLADVGLTTEALAVAGRIKNPSLQNIKCPV